MIRLKNIIAAKVILVFLMSFIFSDENHFSDCENMGSLSVTSSYHSGHSGDSVSEALIAKNKQNSKSDSSIPSHSGHFHCGHSVCCALVVSNADQFSSLLGVGKAFFSVTEHLVGVDLSAIHRPPSA